MSFRAKAHTLQTMQNPYLLLQATGQRSQHETRYKRERTLVRSGFHARPPTSFGNVVGIQKGPRKIERAAVPRVAVRGASMP